jgi:hypothetical protein
MMTPEQVKTIQMVYHRFIDSETEDWTNVDNVLEQLEGLSKEEVIGESAIKYMQHSKGTFRCENNHDQQYCMAPHILEAVGAILMLYKETEKLHPKNAYILHYYLGMSEVGIIYNG